MKDFKVEFSFHLFFSSMAISVQLARMKTLQNCCRCFCKKRLWEFTKQNKRCFCVGRVEKWKTQVFDVKEFFPLLFSGKLENVQNSSYSLQIIVVEWWKTRENSSAKITIYSCSLCTRSLHSTKGADDEMLKGFPHFSLPFIISLFPPCNWWRLNLNWGTFIKWKISKNEKNSHFFLSSLSHLKTCDSPCPHCPRATCCRSSRLIIVIIILAREILKSMIKM